MATCLLAAEDHWAFQAPVSTAQGELPAIIDAEIAKELQAAGLTPSPIADSATLIRRLSLDLRGIPPSIAEIQGFDGDWEALVDRFLASPACAERLTLEWLDVARYADTNGYSIDDLRDMWVWRDWVIHAFLHNKPYDDFIIEQLAGDLLPNASPEQQMATGFLRNNITSHEMGIIPEEYRVTYIADKVDTVASAFMGLTMKCAQCHDHSHDPISQRDYYRFYAFFDSATELGQGASNGNTSPFIAVTSPLNIDIDAAIAARLGRITELRQDVSQLVPTPPANSATRFEMPEKQAQWIWADKIRTQAAITIRRRLTISKPLRKAQIFFACDDTASLHINRKPAAHVESWLLPQLVDVTPHLQAGDNLIRVDGQNAKGVAGFIAWVQLDYVDGTRDYLVSDSSWQWRVPGAVDWRRPVLVGQYGSKPWRFLTVPGRRFDSQSTLGKRLAKNLAIEASELLKRLQEPKTTVMIMDSSGDRTTRVLIRGAYDQPGEEVSPGVPESLSSMPTTAPLNRLGLAQWLVADTHPLTARVIVNRYWQMLFGNGLVRSAEDFGTQGERPSHPELLDTLALRFQASGWDLRHLLKSIAMSKTYRQRSSRSPNQGQVDPKNRLLSSAPRFRLQAELIRDNALAIAGLLEHSLGGPSVYPAQPAGLWRQASHFGEGVFTSQAFYPDRGSATRRRSMYTFWKRTAHPPNMALFDAPSRESCTMRRQRSNTPLQALVLLNDPQYLEAARGLAGRMAAEGGASPLAYAFQLATSRQPTADELAVLRNALVRERSRFREDSAAAIALLRTPQPQPLLAAYTIIASTILNLNETITRQ